LNLIGARGWPFATRTVCASPATGKRVHPAASAGKVQSPMPFVFAMAAAFLPGTFLPAPATR
jgi:hypothetical protein